MREFKLSKKLSKLPPYLFAEIDKQKQILKKRGIDLIDLSIGDPDILAPKEVIASLYNSAKLKENQKYALDKGKCQLRLAIKKWFKERFKVNLDEEKEILPLIGSKEGLVHFPLGFVNPSDYVIIPDPGYPAYRGAAILSGAKIFELPLLEENNFLPDLEKIPLRIRNRAKIIYLNYPNNPTTSLAPRKFLEEVVKFCSKYGVILVYDNAYSEIYFEKKPLSILEIKGAKEVAVEFHSFSKTFCMTGFRMGWACGNKELIGGLLKVKTNIDSGIFGAVQEAGITALNKCSYFPEKVRRVIRERKSIFTGILKEAGFGNFYCDSTFYVWARIPENFNSSIEFSKYLLKEKNIVATPGIGFGKYGEGFIRFALTVDRKILLKSLSLKRLSSV